MPKPIRFEFNYKKLRNLLLYLSPRISDFDTLKIVKYIYLIDKNHLIRFGRPVTGDFYCLMDLGPVPSKTYDIIKDIRDRRTPPQCSESENLKDVFRPNTHSPMSIFRSYAEPDLGVFSQNERKVIDGVIKKYGKLPVGKILDIVHKDATCSDETPLNSEIDFHLFFKDKHASEEALSMMEEEQEDREFLSTIGCSTRGKSS